LFKWETIKQSKKRTTSARRKAVSPKPGVVSPLSFALPQEEISKEDEISPKAEDEIMPENDS
jgi:hypothetical protein